MTIWGVYAVYTSEDVTSESSGGWVGGMRVVGRRSASQWVLIEAGGPGRPQLCTAVD